MKQARIGVIAVAVLAMATIAFAQKPDFSGTWALDPDAMTPRDALAALYELRKLLRR